jgi:O-acetylhomoserine (thiol)-lyase
MSDKEWGFDTLQIHAGQTPDSATGARAVPIYQTTSYVYESAEDAAALFALEKPGFIYTRINNPTVAVLEDRLTALEQGAGALAFASGMAAITAAVQCVCSPGDEIVSASTLYGGTHTLFSARLPQRIGVMARLVDPDDLGAIEAAINNRTKLIYIETIGNPNINIPDIKAIAEIAHRHGLPLVADNTFGTPYLITCKNHGVDIVVHSLTKYIGGHGTSVGGAIVDLGTFDWHNPRFTEFTHPDTTYHGIVYADVPAPFATKARVQLLRDFGACISPFNAFLILQGLETLSLRLDRHCRNALAAATFLKNHPAVEWVNFPPLAGDTYHARACRYFPKGAGSILSFGVKGGLQAGKNMINALKLFSLLANVADARSLVIHPASTTHSQLMETELKAAGVAPEMVRLSIGLEDEKDIINDLDQALRACREVE